MSICEVSYNLLMFNSLPRGAKHSANWFEFIVAIIVFFAFGSFFNVFSIFLSMEVDILGSNYEKMRHLIVMSSFWFELFFVIFSLVVLRIVLSIGGADEGEYFTFITATFIAIAMLWFISTLAFSLLGLLFIKGLISPPVAYFVFLILLLVFILWHIGLVAYSAIEILDYSLFGAIFLTILWFSMKSLFLWFYIWLFWWM